MRSTCLALDELADGIIEALGGFGKSVSGRQPVVGVMEATHPVGPAYALTAAPGTGKTATPG